MTTYEAVALVTAEYGVAGAMAGDYAAISNT
jgi:hypothetical protein